MYNEKELEKEFKEMYKVLKYNYEHGKEMICSNCGQRRIKEVAWEGDHLRRLVCIICNGAYDITNGMLPCHNCKYSYLIHDFFIDRKEDWILRGKSVKNWLIYYQKCVDCYTLRNHDRFFNYKPKEKDVQCDSCKKEYDKLNERIIKLEEKMKNIQTVVYCDECGNKINLEEL